MKEEENEEEETEDDDDDESNSKTSSKNSLTDSDSNLPYNEELAGKINTIQIISPKRSQKFILKFQNKRCEEMWWQAGLFK